MAETGSSRPEDAEDERDPHPQSDVPAAERPERRCRRCHMVITADANEIFFARIGLCYWCAYVDPQG